MVSYYTCALKRSRTFLYSYEESRDSKYNIENIFNENIFCP